MNKYELTLVLSGRLEEGEKVTVLERVQGYITRFNGTVTSVDDWGEKRFAYDIQKMEENFYYFIKFESEGASTPDELEASLRIFEPAVRYLIIRDEVVGQPAQEVAK